MPKEISDVGMHELKKWLQSRNINIRRLHREFSDVGPFAKIVKEYYPRLINLMNYQPRHSTQLKLGNWEAFNYRVLGKLSLRRNTRELEDIARCCPGAIETLLYDFMLLVKASGDHASSTSSKSVDVHDEDDVITVNVNKKKGKVTVPVAQKMISYDIYNKVRNELKFKDVFIETKQKKIKELENLIQFKEAHIKDLCAELNKLTMQANETQYSAQSTNPV